MRSSHPMGERRGSTAISRRKRERWWARLAGRVPGVGTRLRLCRLAINQGVFNKGKKVKERTISSEREFLVLCPSIVSVNPHIENKQRQTFKFVPFPMLMRAPNPIRAMHRRAHPSRTRDHRGGQLFGVDVRKVALGLSLRTGAGFKLVVAAGFGWGWGRRRWPTELETSGSKGERRKTHCVAFSEAGLSCAWSRSSLEPTLALEAGSRPRPWRFRSELKQFEDSAKDNRRRDRTERSNNTRGMRRTKNDETRRE